MDGEQNNKKENKMDKKQIKKYLSFLKKKGNLFVDSLLNNKKEQSEKSKKEKICLNTNNTEKIQKNMEDFEKQLRTEGHTCIQILESYPIQINWCKSNICKGNIE